MLRLNRLEPRDVPATFDAAFYDQAFVPIPGWAGPVSTTVGDFDGNGSVDTAYAAGPDGAPRVVVYSGGKPNRPLVPSATPGVDKTPGADDVIADFFAFEEGFRGGADVTSVRVPGGADRLVFVPGEGGGPRVRVMDLAGGADFSFMAFDDPDYRGGLNVRRTIYAPEFPAGEHLPGTHLIVTPRAGGGPRAAVYDAAGTQVTTFLVGPAADRREYTVFASDVDLPGEPGRRGLYVTTPEGAVAAFDWTGTEYPNAGG
jgi:hypothetical protein